MLHDDTLPTFALSLSNEQALYAAHRDTVWDYAKARVLHYTMAKPWDLRHPCNAPYAKLNMLWY